MNDKRYIYQATVYFTDEVNEMLSRLCSDSLIKTNKLDKSKMICEAIRQYYNKQYGVK